MKFKEKEKTKIRNVSSELHPSSGNKTRMDTWSLPSWFYHPKRILVQLVTLRIFCFISGYCCPLYIFFNSTFFVFDCGAGGYCIYE